MTSDPLSFLDAVSGYTRAQSQSSADRPVRLAVVDPAYAGHPALPKVTFEGETVMGARTYAYSYPVAAGDRVAMLPIGTTYIIIGRVGGPTGLGVAFGGTGKTSVTAGNYLKGAGTSALVEVTPANVRSEIGANNATNLTTGDLPPARLQDSIVSGSVSITPSGANVPTTVTWSYGRTLTGTVRAVVAPNTTVPGTTVTGCSVTTPGASSVAVYLTRTNTSLTIVYGIAMGGFG